MAASGRAAGTWVAQNTTTTSTVTLPTHAAGDMLIVRAACKHANIDGLSPTCATEGWAKLGQYQNGTTASSNGGGSVLVAVFWKVATSNAETDPVVTWHASVAPNPGGVVAISYQKASTEGWETPVGDGGPFAANLSISATIQSHVSAKAGDLIDAFIGVCDNNTTTVPTFTQAGLTLDTVVEYPAGALSSATGNDMSYDGCYRVATVGTSSAAAVVTGTQGAADAGAAWTTRLRVTPTVTLSLLQQLATVVAPALSSQVAVPLLAQAGSQSAPTLQAAAAQIGAVPLAQQLGTQFAPTAAGADMGPPLNQRLATVLAPSIAAALGLSLSQQLAAQQSPALASTLGLGLSQQLGSQSAPTVGAADMRPPLLAQLGVQQGPALSSALGLALLAQLADQSSPTLQEAAGQLVLPLAAQVGSQSGFTIAKPTQTTIGGFALGPGIDPGDHTDHRLLIRARVLSGTGTAVLRCALYENGEARSDVLETPPLSTEATTYTFLLGEAVASSIVSYSDLEVLYWGYDIAGGGQTFKVDMVALAIPPSVGNVLGPPLLAADTAQFDPDIGIVMDVPAIESTRGLSAPGLESSVSVTLPLASQLASQDLPALSSSMGMDLLAQLGAVMAPSLGADVAVPLSQRLASQSAPALWAALGLPLSAQTASQLPPSMVASVALTLLSQLATQSSPTIGMAGVALTLLAQLGIVQPPSLASGMSLSLNAKVGTTLSPALSTTVGMGLLAQLASQYGPSIADVGVSLPLPVVAQLASQYGMTFSRSVPVPLLAQLASQSGMTLITYLTLPLSAQLATQSSPGLIVGMPVPLLAQLATQHDPRLVFVMGVGLNARLASTYAPELTAAMAIPLSVQLAGLSAPALGQVDIFTMPLLDRLGATFAPSLSVDIGLGLVEQLASLVPFEVRGTDQISLVLLAQLGAQFSPTVVLLGVGDAIGLPIHHALGLALAGRLVVTPGYQARGHAQGSIVVGRATTPGKVVVDDA